MKLLSIAAGRSGDCPNRHCTLEVAAVLFDPCPDLQETTPAQRRWQFWECLILNRNIAGTPDMLAEHADTLKEIGGGFPEYKQRLWAAEVVPAFRKWLYDHGVSSAEPVTVVGDGYDRIDRPFLCRLPSWEITLEPYLLPRALDVGSLCFRPDAGMVSSLDTNLDVLGVTTTVSHRAEDRALQIATVASRFFT